MERADRRIILCTSCGTEAAMRTSVQVQGSAVVFLDCARCDRAWFVRDGCEASLREVAPLLAKYLGAPAAAAHRSTDLAPVVSLGQARRMPGGSAAPSDGGFAIPS
jgi:hypothetical protein